MEDVLRPIIIPAFASLLLLTSSCSWFRDMQRSIVDEDEKVAKRKRPVSREQYDQLLVKYEELSRKYESLKENPKNGAPSLVDDLHQSKMQNFNNTNETETVDVFAANKAEATPRAPNDLADQLSLYRKGFGLKKSNSAEAIKIFQQLEGASSSVGPRAKFQIGEIMLSKQQYDIALQMFEEIINKHASSGVVLESLKHAVVCSDKLGLKSKKDQYSSMLVDVFETNE